MSRGRLKFNISVTHADIGFQRVDLKPLHAIFVDYFFGPSVYLGFSVSWRKETTIYEEFTNIKIRTMLIKIFEESRDLNNLTIAIPLV